MMQQIISALHGYSSLTPCGTVAITLVPNEIDNEARILVISLLADCDRYHYTSLIPRFSAAIEEGPGHWSRRIEIIRKHAVLQLTHREFCSVRSLMFCGDNREDAGMLAFGYDGQLSRFLETSFEGPEDDHSVRSVVGGAAGAASSDREGD